MKPVAPPHSVKVTKWKNPHHFNKEFELEGVIGVVQVKVIMVVLACCGLFMGFSSKVNCVMCQVTLHRIPPQLINYEPTPTRFHLDTLKDTKKFVLDFEYPDNVKVDTSKEPVAEFDRGILTCRSSWCIC